MKASIKNLFVCIVLLSPAGLCAQYGDQISGNDFLRTVKVNRWVSPVVGDFVTIPESHATDAQMASWGYKSKTFQYEAWIDNPGPFQKGVTSIVAPLTQHPPFPPSSKPSKSTF